MPVAQRVCIECGVKSEKVSKTPADFIPAGKTAITREKNIVKGKVHNFFFQIA